MFVALWEFEVKPGREEGFEKAYGPQGEWARLFRHDPSYLETRLLRDAAHNSVYLTLDVWNSRTAYEQFLETHAADYKRLDAASEDLTLVERKIGWFETVAE
jgi:heme-degrading monooxygenase HmoA